MEKNTIAHAFTSEMRDIIQNEHFLTGLSLPDHHIVLLMNWKGGEHVSYAMFHKSQVLFTGTDYKPSPLHGYDSIESAIDLLAFLVVQPGDTDPGYFAHYVPAQMKFAESYTAEVIKGLISDFECKDSEYNADAVTYFEAAVITYDTIAHIS